MSRARSRVAAFIDDLGVISDAEIAKRAGVTSAAVHQYRTRLGVSRAPRTGPAEGVERARAVVAAADPRLVSPEEAHAWRVAFVGPGVEVTRIVVATSVAAAGELASRWGEVLRIERLGLAIA